MYPEPTAAGHYQVSEELLLSKKNLSLKLSRAEKGNKRGNIEEVSLRNKETGL